MKNRSITYLLLFGICSMLAIMQSCQKTDDLEADINSLKDRVAALEKATEGLNTSFASLQALMQKTKSLSELLRLKMVWDICWNLVTEQALKSWKVKQYKRLSLNFP